MGNSGPVVYKDEIHPVSTPTSGRKTDAPGGPGWFGAEAHNDKVEIRDQLTSPDMGPKFRSVLPRDPECSTGKECD